MRSRVAVASHSFPKHEALRRELLQRYPDALFNETRQPLAGDALIAFLNGFEKAITGLEVLDASVFDAVPELRIVSKYGVGLDMIDLNAARARGVSIRWTPGVNRQAVAELTIAFMIALARNLLPAVRDLRDGKWPQGGGRQLSSAVVGIVGCGHVGKSVARLCRAFGARVVAYDIRRYDDFYRDAGITPVSFEELLRGADFVTLHLPLDESTRGMFGAPRFAAMKPTSFLVNTSRGGIVDETALARALVDRTIAGAASDVFGVEPPADRDLLKLANFVGTPHIGGSSIEAALAMGRAAIAGLDDPDRDVSKTLAEAVP
jgi:phosphoglycerate dehydrogenase-like enzyme